MEDDELRWGRGGWWGDDEEDDEEDDKDDDEDDDQDNDEDDDEEDDEGEEVEGCTSAGYSFNGAPLSQVFTFYTDQSAAGENRKSNQMEHCRENTILYWGKNTFLQLVTFLYL